MTCEAVVGDLLLFDGLEVDKLKVQLGLTDQPGPATFVNGCPEAQLNFIHALQAFCVDWQEAPWLYARCGGLCAHPIDVTSDTLGYCFADAPAMQSAALWCAP